MEHIVLNFLAILLSFLSMFGGFAHFNSNVDEPIKIYIMFVIFLLFSAFILAGMTFYYSSKTTRIYFLVSSLICLILALLLYFVIIVKILKTREKNSRNVAIFNILSIITCLTIFGFLLKKTLSEDGLDLVPSSDLDSEIKIKPIATEATLKPPY